VTTGHSLSRRRALVTGAAGFLGANLVRSLLEAGCEVHALVHPRTDLVRLEGILPSLELHRADLTNRESVGQALRESRPDLVFHLAAIGGHPVDPESRDALIASVVLGTAHLLHSLRSGNVSRFVQLGSGLEYGHSEEPLAEDHLLQPVTFRGAAKAAATLLCGQEARTTGRSFVVLRPFSVYGPWESPIRFIPSVIRAGLENAPLSLTSNGIRRDYVYVADVVEACLLSAGADLLPGEILNIGSGSPSTDQEVVAAVEGLLGRRIAVCRGGFPSRDLDSRVWIADRRRASERLGWEPRHSLSSGLAKTIAWFRKAREEGASS
jgi:nucleoside-diphosphate-sugar epimerase